MGFDNALFLCLHDIDIVTFALLLRRLWSLLSLPFAFFFFYV